jgi:hypothetical protein
MRNIVGRETSGEVPRFCDRPGPAGRGGLNRRRFLAWAALPFLFAGRTARATPDAAFADMHAHPVVNLRATSMPAAATIISAMDARGIHRTILAPPPATREDDDAGTYGAVKLSALVAEAPGRLAFSAGGESLNPMLQRVPASSVTPELLAAFRAAALGIAQAGAAAFAELGAEVLPAGKNMPGGHSHQTSPADHPFLLALAGIAADFAMPIGLHMEALTGDGGGPENISAMERLLASNRQARIVWLHAGWDRSGQRSVELMQMLLQRHPNLFMALKTDHLGIAATAPLHRDGRLKAEWLTMLRNFSDRFVIGSDQFYDRAPERIDGVRQIVNALPADVARQIGSDNPGKIYRLPG